MIVDYILDWGEDSCKGNYWDSSLNLIIDCGLDNSTISIKYPGFMKCIL